MGRQTGSTKRGLDESKVESVSKKIDIVTSSNDSSRSRSESTDEGGITKVEGEKKQEEEKEGVKDETSASPTDVETGEKKKENSKGKLFQCTGYPGCSMVFTRSEHLARHIRKHTGERPFECETCKKRFSRLDNLRQHKQTVHSYDFDRGFKVSKKTKKLRTGEEPITPSVISEFNTLSSPPNSVSPHIKRNEKKLPPPPPRQPIFLQKQESFSDTRNKYNKPMPLVLEDAATKTNDGLRIITPTTGNGSVMEMNSPGGSRLNHLKIQLHSSSVAAPMASPSMSSYMGVNSPGVNLVGPMNSIGSVGSVSENPSPYGLVFGPNSTSVTPTNAAFDFQRQTAYTSPVYYQRVNQRVQYQMNNTPNQPLHQLRRGSFNQRNGENGEEEEKNQTYPTQYVSYLPFSQMNLVSPMNQYSPIPQSGVSPMLNQLGQPGPMYNPIHMSHVNQPGAINQIYNQFPNNQVGYTPYHIQPQFQQQNGNVNFPQNNSQPPSATTKTFPNVSAHTSISTSISNQEYRNSGISSVTSVGLSTASTTGQPNNKADSIHPPPLPKQLAIDTSTVKSVNNDPKESKSTSETTEKNSAEPAAKAKEPTPVKSSSKSNCSRNSSHNSNSSSITSSTNNNKKILLENILNG